MYIAHCAKNNQNLRIKTKPVTTGAIYAIIRHNIQNILVHIIQKTLTVLN